MLRHVGDVLDLAADHLEIALAGFGQGDVAPDPRGQRGAEMQFQRLDLLADRRGRHPQFVRRAGNRTRARHRMEDDDGAEGYLHQETF